MSPPHPPQPPAAPAWRPLAPRGCQCGWGRRPRAASSAHQYPFQHSGSPQSSPQTAAVPGGSPKRSRGQGMGPFHRSENRGRERTDREVALGKMGRWVGQPGASSPTAPRRCPATCRAASPTVIPGDHHCGVPTKPPPPSPPPSPAPPRTLPPPFLPPPPESLIPHHALHHLCFCHLHHHHLLHLHRFHHHCLFCPHLISTTMVSIYHHHLHYFHLHQFYQRHLRLHQ